MLHATAESNFDAIWCRGLHADKARSKLKTVWLVSPGQIGAAITHAHKRHGTSYGGIVVVEVNVPRSWLTKGRRKYLWHTGGRDVPSELITAVYWLQHNRVRNDSAATVPRATARAQVESGRRRLARTTKGRRRRRR